MNSTDYIITVVVVVDPLGGPTPDVMDADTAGLGMDGAVGAGVSAGVCTPLAALNVAYHILIRSNLYRLKGEL